MGSPQSSVIANLFMEGFKTRTLLSSSPNPPRIWFRILNDFCHSHPSKLLGPKHTVHQGIHRPTRLPSILGHPNTKRTRWHPHHHSLLEAKKKNTYQYLHWESPQHHQQTVFRTLSHIGPSVSVPTNNY